MYENTYKMIINTNIDVLYKIMKDINNYSKIIPYIKSISYIDENREPIKAHIVLEHWLIKLEYDCDIYFDEQNHSIKVYGYGYSFEEINGLWNLKKLSDNTTQVSYKLQFKMKYRLQQKIGEKVFALYGDKIRDKISKHCSELT